MASTFSAPAVINSGSLSLAAPSKTMNSQGCAFLPEGASVAASRTCPTSSRGTGLSWNLRILRLFSIASPNCIGIYSFGWGNSLIIPNLVQECVLICRFIDEFTNGLARAMAGPHLHPQQNGIISLVFFLQGGGKFHCMARNNPVIGIRRHD